MPLIVSILFTLAIIGAGVAIIALFVAGILALTEKDILPGDDDDDHRGGDEGFTPDPWVGPETNPIEQHEDELTLV